MTLKRRKPSPTSLGDDVNAVNNDGAPEGAIDPGDDTEIESAILPEHDPALTPAQCRRRAMDALARREQTRLELERKLTKIGFAGDLIAETLDTLAAEGLQSDQRFAEAFVASRYRQGKGPVRIRAELGQRGLSRPEIADALATADFDWFTLAADVRVQRFGEAPPADLAARAKQTRFLSYRGFDAEQTRSAIELAQSAADAAGVEFDGD